VVIIPETMLKLTLAVLAIALPDCINPTLIGGQLLVATRAHPRRQTMAFTIGAFVVTFVFGLALALGVGDLILSVVPKPGPTVKYALVTAAGLALLLGGAVVMLERRRLASSQQSSSRRTRHGAAGLIGAGLAGVELLTAFPYFAAIAMIIGSGVSRPEKLTLLIVYCVIYTLPLIVIAGAFAVLGDAAEKRVRPFGDWMVGHWPLIVGPITAAIGFVLLVLGVVELISL
jgi:cytochrome c biogenesis protein CcdA